MTSKTQTFHFGSSPKRLAQGGDYCVCCSNIYTQDHLCTHPMSDEVVTNSPFIPSRPREGFTSIQNTMISSWSAQIVTYIITTGTHPKGVQGGDYWIHSSNINTQYHLYTLPM